MSMFKTLAPFAADAPVTIIISPSGDRLHAFITQNKEKTDNALDLSLIATAEELDTQLPLAIAEHLARPDKSVAEQVKDQVDAQQESADTKATTKKPAKKSAAKPAAKKPAAKKPTPQKSKPAAPSKPKTPAKPRPAKTSAKPTKAERKATRSAAAAAIKTPVQTPILEPLIKKPVAPAEAGAQPTPTTDRLKASLDRAVDAQADKRAACLTDLRNAIALHGEKVTRRQFAELSNTGRSFERLFGSWENFRAALGKDMQKPGEVMQETGNSSQQVGNFMHAVDESTKQPAELVHSPGVTGAEKVDDKTLPLPGIETPPAAPAPAAAQSITASLI